MMEGGGEAAVPQWAQWAALLILSVCAAVVVQVLLATRGTAYRRDADGALYIPADHPGVPYYVLRAILCCRLRCPPRLRAADFQAWTPRLRTVMPATLEADRVAEFAAACGYRPGEDAADVGRDSGHDSGRDEASGRVVPPTYLQAVSEVMSMAAATCASRADWPLPLLPLPIHAAQTIELFGEQLCAGDGVLFVGSPPVATRTRRGMELRLDSHGVDGGNNLRFRGSMTGFYRLPPDPTIESSGNSGGAATAASPADEIGALTAPVRRHEWVVDARTAREYAAASDDYNPTHLLPWCGRAVGFPGAVVHGMWTAARVHAQCVADGALPYSLPTAASLHAARVAAGTTGVSGGTGTTVAPPSPRDDGGGGTSQPRFRMSIAFRRPIVLPSTVVCSYSLADAVWVPAAGASADAPLPPDIGVRRITFLVHTPANDAVYARGTMELFL